MVFFHIFFIVNIAFCAYFAYAAWFKDFGERFYNTLQRMPFLGFFMFPKPKTLPNFIKLVRVSMLLNVLCFTALYIWLLCS